MLDRSIWLGLIRPTAALGLTALGPVLGGAAVLTLSYSHADTLQHGGTLMVLLVLLAGVLGVGLVLVPTHVLSLVSGWAFGVPMGLAVAVVCAAAGTPLGYGLGRWIAGDPVQGLAQRDARAEAICKAIKQAPLLRATWLVCLLRMSPIIPYGSTNVLAAILRVPLLPLVLGTVVGLTPRAAAAVIIGAGLDKLNDPQPASPWLWGVGIGATLLLAVFLNLFAKRAIRRSVIENERPISLTASDQKV